MTSSGVRRLAALSILAGVAVLGASRVEADRSDGGADATVSQGVGRPVINLLVSLQKIHVLIDGDGGGAGAGDFTFYADVHRLSLDCIHMPELPPVGLGPTGFTYDPLLRVCQTESFPPLRKDMHGGQTHDIDKAKGDLPLFNMHPADLLVVDWKAKEEDVWPNPDDWCGNGLGGPLRKFILPDNSWGSGQQQVVTCLGEGPIALGRRPPKVELHYTITVIP